MSQSVTIHLTEDGTMRFLVSEDTEALLGDNSTVRRASHVEPVGYVLRGVFHGLRYLFGEKGHMARFTRLWPCLWRINLSPIGGTILPTTYRNRAKAIESEVDYLNENFI